MQLTQLISFSGHETRLTLPSAALVLYYTIETDLAKCVKSASLLKKEEREEKTAKSIADVSAGQILNCMIKIGF